MFQTGMKNNTPTQNHKQVTPLALSLQAQRLGHIL